MVRKIPLTRAWFFPTNPRSPEILQKEFPLLKDFDGKLWNKTTQTEYGVKWSEEYSKGVFLKEPDFSARDRVNRAPKMLGFVHIPPVQEKSPLSITEAGRYLLNNENLSNIYLRQISKIQFPSYIHRGYQYDHMNIRPLTTLISFILDLDEITQEELLLFVLTTINYKEIKNNINLIKDFRKLVRKKTAGIERQMYREELGRSRLADVYKDDIKSGSVKVREGGKDMIITKRRNLKDYSDATIRYISATGLFYFDRQRRSIKLSESNKLIAETLLSDLGTNAIQTRMTYKDWIEKHYGNPNEPVLLADNFERRKELLQIYNKKIHTSLRNEYNKIQDEINLANESSKLSVLMSRLDTLMGNNSIINTRGEIMKDRSENWKDIKGMYDQISERTSKLTMKPLFYEWNTWRALHYLGNPKNIMPNFKMDYDNNPITTAPSKLPDILIEFDNYWLTVEVTLQSGYKQYESEGESIIRHLGSLQRENIQKGDERPCFGLFIAEKIKSEVINYLQISSMKETSIFSGPVKIFPIERIQLLNYIEEIIGLKNEDKNPLESFFRSIFDKKYILLPEDEWHQIGINGLLKRK